MLHNCADELETKPAIATDTTKLARTDVETGYCEFSQSLSDAGIYGAMSHASNPYGDGCASRRIADVLAEGVL